MPDYGIFLELEDGIEGLVHISEMTWNKRVKHPSKLVEIGQEVEAKVLGVDVENRRISLGMRQLEPNPWDLVEERYPVGSILKGKVRNITDFGVFVGIEEGIDGLIHVSDIGWSSRAKKPQDMFEKGVEVEARVLNIDKENERFSLGLKQLKDNPWLSVQSRYFLGQVVKATVVASLDFGVFAEIEDGVEGLVHVSELVHSEGDWAEQYPNGKQILVEIIHIDAHERKISLSEKGAQERGGESGSADDYLKAQSTGSARSATSWATSRRSSARAARRPRPPTRKPPPRSSRPRRPRAEPAKKGGKKKVRPTRRGEGTRAEPALPRRSVVDFRQEVPHLTRTAVWIRLFLFVVFVVAPVALFAVQNWSRVSDVSFDYYAGKLQTAQPVAASGAALRELRGRDLHRALRLARGTLDVRVGSPISNRSSSAPRLT
jgi:predicted RNA-binding protein with RPS1 domain